MNKKLSTKNSTEHKQKSENWEKIILNISGKNSLKFLFSFFIEAPLININKESLRIKGEEINKGHNSKQYEGTYYLYEIKNIENNLLKINNLHQFKEYLIKNIKNENYKLVKRNNFLFLFVNYNFLSFKKDFSVLMLKEEDSKNEMKTFHKMFHINKDSIEKETLDNKINEKLNLDYFLNHKRKLLIEKKNDNEVKIPIKKESFLLNKSIDDFFGRVLSKSQSEFDKNNLVRESSIIYNEEEASLINNEIECPPKKFKLFKLIFRASEDGDSATTFHSICDKISNIIVLIETKQGKRFGGYTSVKFGGTAHLKKDNKAFLFSLDHKKIFKINSDKYAIYCYPNSGPCFSYGSLHIPNNFFLSPGKAGAINSAYNFSFNFELNDGKENFIVNELEIFRVKVMEN